MNRKKITTVLQKLSAPAIVFIITALSYAQIYTAAPAAKKKLQLAYAYSSTTSTEDAQFMNIMAEVLKIGLKNYPGGYTLTPYKNGKEILAAAKAGTVDFTFTFNNDLSYDLMVKHKFKPIATYSVYKKDMMTPCLYVKSDRLSGGIAAMKGKRIALQREYRYMYYALRKLVGERPDVYFKIVPTAGEYSALYALALDDADAAFVNTVAFDYTKVSNPGSIKNVKPLACGADMKFTPVLSSKQPPPGSADVITKLLMSATKDDAFKQFRPLFKTASLKMLPAGEADYTSLLKLFDEAAKKGWDKEYQGWLRYISK